MSATLYFNGIRISVPTNELAEALRQLALVASAPTPQPMGALSLAEQMQPELDVFTEKHSENDLALAFLKAIADHKVSGGAPISAIMPVVGASHVKGVGSKTAIINRVLDKLGFAIPDVYTNDRDSAGMRNWVAGPRFADALRALSPASESTAEEDEDL